MQERGRVATFGGVKAPRRAVAARPIEIAGRLGRWIADCWAHDADRRVLWAPVLFGAGAAAYFAAPPAPPPMIAAGVVAALAAAIVLRYFSRPDAAAFAAAPFALAALAAGYLAADMRERIVAAPIVQSEIGPTRIIGRVIAIDARPSGVRLLLSPDFIGGLYPPDHPATLRLTWRGDMDAALRAGDRIVIRGVLRPPPGPTGPGAFDFARQAYFQRLGAVGYAVSPPRLLDDKPETVIGRTARTIERVRENLAAHIYRQSPDDAGAIAAALVTGKRGAIPEDAATALRDSGLAHLLAISGMHMGLAAGLFFFGVRFTLSFIGPAALKLPIKKWAAVIALAGAAGYLVLSGAPWPTRRAFIMTALVLLAVLFDRRAISMRTVAIAAGVIVVFNPEAVLHAGFQMSFSAVIALIAAYEYWMSRSDNFLARAPRRGVFGVVRAYIIALTATSIIAGAATDVFAAYHFNRVALYGLFGNLGAMPIATSFVAPAAVGAALLSLVGLEEWGFKFMTAGLHVVLAIAREVSSWPGAVGAVKAGPPWALIMVIAGGLWLCLWAASWRWIGVGVIVLGLAGWAAATPPDVLVSRNGGNVAVRVDDGRLGVYSARRARFDTESWQRANGELPDIPAAARRWREAARCREPVEGEGQTCLVRTRGGAEVGVAETADGVAALCAEAILIVSLAPVPASDMRECGAHIIDPDDARANGAHAIWIGRNGAVTVKRSQDRRHYRPWAAQSE